VTGEDEERTRLRQELDLQRDLVRWIREALYGIEPAGPRHLAATAVAAAAAQECYRIADGARGRLNRHRLVNRTSRQWRGHLDGVWEYLAGDSSRHYPLSAALAEFLVSPLNHVEGQDGPDDFDRPQTIAAHYAVVGVVFGVVDTALLAVGQVFECLDLRYDGAFPDERRAAVDGTVERVRGWVDTVRDGAAGHHEALPAAVVAALRTGPRS
jgi:hypothetical protein